MSHTLLWESIHEQAAAWAAVPTFQRFAAQLPRNAPQRQSELPELLQNVEARGGRISACPLRARTEISLMAPLMQGVDPRSLGTTWTSWLQDAQRVELAHRDTVAWIRSRLPGYPSLPAPQLAPGTPLTTTEITWRLIWAPGERSKGLQFQPAPPQAPSILQATEEQRRRLNQSACSVAAAFEHTNEWQHLATATQTLDHDARASLSRVRTQLRRRLSDQAIDAHEPDLAMPRDRYRQVVLSEEINTLTGAAREYADAFDALDQLVETAASDVFGQLAAYGDPTTFNGLRDLDVQPRAAGRAITFILTLTTWPEQGMIAWIDDPLITDAVRITEVKVSLSIATGEVVRVTGTVLAGTATAWRRTT